MRLGKATPAYEIELRADNKSPDTIRRRRQKLHFSAGRLAGGDSGRVEHQQATLQSIRRGRP